MSIIKRNVSKLGEFWIKKTFPMTLDDDGEEHPLAALAFPEYTWPGYLWCKWSVMSVAEKSPWSTAEFNMKARHVNVPQNLSFADNMQALMETHAPIDESAAINPSGTTAADVDITGGEHAMHCMNNTFFERQYKFGLPNNAYPCNANAIRYTAFGSYKGNVKTPSMVDVCMPSMIFIGGLTNSAYTTTNQSLSVYGDHSDFGNIYESLVDAITRTRTTENQQLGAFIDGAAGASPSAGLAPYQSIGFSTDDASEEADPATINDNADLMIKLDVTCRLDVYEADYRSRLLAP